MIDTTGKNGTVTPIMAETKETAAPKAAGNQTAASKAEAAEKAKALDSALVQIEKQFGKGAVMKLNADAMKEIPVISTGALSLDLALGVGGVPRGRIIEIYGPESSGKTTLTLHIVAEAQKLGGMAAFIDGLALFSENLQRHHRGESMAYSDKDICACANHIRRQVNAIAGAPESLSTLPLDVNRKPA